MTAKGALGTRFARGLYRTRQVVRALRPRIDAAALEAALTALTEPQKALFLAMERRDQRHALEVLQRLGEAASDPDLRVAALLHDCGKGRAPIWLRVLHVLAPRASRRLAKAGTGGWRAAAYRLAHHAELGAAKAEAAGASPAAVRLIRGRPAPGEDAKLALLLAADDAS